MSYLGGINSVASVLEAKLGEKWDFSGSPVAKSLPSNAGDTGLIPGQGTKISHAAGHLSPRATMKDPHAGSRTRCSQINNKIVSAP